MRKIAYILLTLMLFAGGMAAWAESLPEAAGSCCEDCSGEAGGDCCSDVLCCHSAQVFALVGIDTTPSSEEPVIGRTDCPAAVITIGELDLSLDLPPRTISC